MNEGYLRIAIRFIDNTNKIMSVSVNSENAGNTIFNIFQDITYLTGYKLDMKLVDKGYNKYIGTEIVHTLEIKEENSFSNPVSGDIVANYIVAEHNL